MKPTIKILDEEYIDKGYALQKKILGSRTARGLNLKSSIKAKDRILLPVKELSVTVQNRIKSLKESETELVSSVEEIGTKDSELIKFILSFIKEQPKRHKPFEQHYQRYRLCDEELETYCQTHALISTLIGFKNEGYQVRTIYEAYKHLRLTTNFTNFQCSSYDYFTTKLKEAADSGIESVIVNAKRLIGRSRKKFTKTHEKFTIHYYKNPARFKYRVIQEKVNNEITKKGLLPVSLTVIKDFLRQPEIQNRYKPFRIGKVWAKHNLFPYLPITKPKLLNSKWELDSSEINLFVWPDENSKKPIRYVLCILVEVKSRKILGFHIRETEDSILNEITLFNAIKETNTIPHEFVHDNHSSLVKSERFNLIKSRMEDWGCCITICEPYAPEQKGTVERAHGILQADYFAYTPGWLGFNSGAKSEESRITSQQQNEFYKGKYKMYFKELILMVTEYIDRYNNAKIWN